MGMKSVQPSQPAAQAPQGFSATNNQEFSASKGANKSRGQTAEARGAAVTLPGHNGNKKLADS